MRKLNVFLDSSALIAGIISETGAAHVLLQLGETGDLQLTVSEMVIEETERAIAIKAPAILKDAQKEIIKSGIKIMADPSSKEIQANLYLMDDPYDVPILLAAMKANVDYLAAHDHRHFLDNSRVMEKSGLKIGTPGDVLVWIRENL